MKLKFIKPVIQRMFGKKDAIISYLKKDGVKIGKNPRIFSDITTTESYLISLGDDVTIGSGVLFITHDGSAYQYIDGATDVFGRIDIGNNCFIGMRSIVMYGVTLADNTIVAAGSVVTKSVTESGKIIGGNPAKIIGDVKDFAQKNEKYALNLKNMSPKEKKKLLTESDKYQIKR